ncbi:hypothetical protein [uncultured Ruegeria sp.]|uniref:hypothetical protein n=1 Tax=uncultured Ruegeria sp. TaxID=259304 RepID=UPI0026116927|nr:hypothetical protein [uncultured Ruegeria sp.]
MNNPKSKLNRAHTGIPEVPDSGASGNQKHTSIEGEVLPPVTEAKYASGEFVGTVKRIAEENVRGISGANTSYLIAARLRELEQENNELRSQNRDLTEQVADLKSDLALSQADVRVEREKRDSAKSEKKYSTAILVAAGILVTLAFVPNAEPLEGRDWAILGVAAIAYLVGIFGTAFFSKGKS